MDMVIVLDLFPPQSHQKSKELELKILAKIKEEAIKPGMDFLDQRMAQLDIRELYLEEILRELKEEKERLKISLKMKENVE